MLQTEPLTARKNLVFSPEVSEGLPVPEKSHERREMVRLSLVSDGCRRAEDPLAKR